MSTRHHIGSLDVASFQMLRDASQALGATGDAARAGEVAMVWARRAIEEPAATVRLVVPDRRGRLRTVGQIGSRTERGRKRSARRRDVMQTGESTVLELADPPGHALAMIPLEAEGNRIGLLEIVAPAEAVRERKELLEVVTAQAAGRLHDLQRRAELEQQVAVYRDVGRLAQTLLSVDTPEQAVRMAMRFCAARLDAPAACWLGRDDPTRRPFVGARGLGGVKRQELRRALGAVPRREPMSARDRGRLSRIFAELAGVDEVTVLEAGDALLIVGGATAEMDPHFETVRTLLVGVLNHLSAVAWAERRNEQLDRGIALTAHEVRGPLLGAAAVMDRLTTGVARRPSDVELLRRSRRDLRRLAETVDGLLRWAVGPGSIQRRRTDLVQIVHQAIETCILESGQDRVEVVAPSAVPVSADPKHLRIAIANVVRNSLAYSPSGTTVVVSVEEGEEGPQVSVRDRGPGIAPDDREAIFDPFARARSDGGPRGGHGLGLFIARRIVQGHGGSIWLAPGRPGATFRIQLPAAARRAA